MIFWFYLSTAVVITVPEFFRKPTQRSNFAPCGPPYGPAERCAVRSGYYLESPGLQLEYGCL